MSAFRSPRLPRRAAAALLFVVVSADRTPSAQEPPAVDQYSELMIVHPAVVDPLLNGGRSHNGGPATPGGPWSLRTLLEKLSFPMSTSSRHAFYGSLFESWKTSQTTSNGTTLPARNGAAVDVFLQKFSQVDGSGNRTYQLWKLPFELIAIVNRIDLRAKDASGAPTGANAGELRFVYRLVYPEEGVQQFTMNLEYQVRTNFYSVETWAQNWHKLSTLEVGSEEYLAALEQLTHSTTSAWANTPPSLGHIRTNEIVFANPNGVGVGNVWQLREFVQFRGTPATNTSFKASAVRNTPDRSFNVDGPGTFDLTNFIVDNIRGGATDCDVPGRVCLDDGGTEPIDFQMPEQIPSAGGPVTLLGPSAETGVRWAIEGDSESDTIDNFGLLTCNGCHEDNKVNLTAPLAADREMHFYHVNPEVEPGPDGVARLSRFLTTYHSSRRPGELNRRKAILQGLLARPWTPYWIF